MTIGYVLKRYPRFSETFIVNEILAHEKAGAKIRIYALGPVQETHFQEAIARVRAPVHRIRHQYHDTLLYWQHLRKAHAQLPNFDTELALSEEHDAATIGQAITLALTAREHGITHLHAHFGTQAATIARLAGHFAAIPYSFTAHAKDIYHHYAEPVNLATKIQDAAFTITVSDYNLAHLRAEYHSSAPIYRIYNGLDLDQFPYQIPRDRPPHILAVGRLVEKKGFNHLIDAIARLRRDGIACECTIIGEGGKRSELAAYESTLRIASLTLAAIVYRVYTLDLYLIQSLDRLLDLDLVGIGRDAEDVALSCLLRQGCCLLRDNGLDDNSHDSFLLMIMP